MKINSTITPFSISRLYDAPKELVYKAWTEKDRLVQWWGPRNAGVKQCVLDFRVDGKFHYCLSSARGGDYWGLFIFTEIVPNEKLVFINTLSDPEGNITTHPMMPDWPKEILTTLTFEEQDGKTLFTLTAQPVNASVAEEAAFEQGKSSLGNGWDGGLEKLGEYLVQQA